jgi:hypothetical protein
VHTGAWCGPALQRRWVAEQPDCILQRGQPDMRRPGVQDTRCCGRTWGPAHEQAAVSPRRPPAHRQPGCSGPGVDDGLRPRCACRGRAHMLLAAVCCISGSINNDDSLDPVVVCTNVACMHDMVVPNSGTPTAMPLAGNRR